MDYSRYSQCFGCGADNPSGLHIHHYYEGDKSLVEYEVRPEHCGYPGMLHGGITCTIMDEAMFYAVARLDIETVTLAMSVDYKSPALAGERLIGEGWLLGRDGRKIDVSATLKEQNTGRLVASGTGKFLEVDWESLLRSISPGR